MGLVLGLVVLLTLGLTGFVVPGFFLGDDDSPAKSQETSATSGNPTPDKAGDGADDVSGKEAAEAGIALIEKFLDNAVKGTDKGDRRAKRLACHGADRLPVIVFLTGFRQAVSAVPKQIHYDLSRVKATTREDGAHLISVKGKYAVFGTVYTEAVQAKHLSGTKFCITTSGPLN